MCHRADQSVNARVRAIVGTALSVGSIPVCDRRVRGRKSLIPKRADMVSRNFASWNQTVGWLRAVEVFKRAA